jgi:Zn-dependent protease
MRFRLFGIPVEVQPGFWLVSGLFGMHLLYQSKPLVGEFLVWVAVVFVSIMVHELGHAFAILRHGLRPSITLHGFGGLTHWQGAHLVGRGARFFISFAGPLAGFALAALVYGAERSLGDAGMRELPWLARVAAAQLWWVNFYWGLFNLLPLMPLDGGNMLEAALGPERTRAATITSLAVAAVAGAWFLYRRDWWPVVIIGLCAVQTYQRFQMTAAAMRRADPGRPVSTPPPRESDGPAALDAETRAELARAKRALEDDRYDEAGTLAELVLARRPPPAARRAALEILAWAHLLEGRADEAARVVRALEREGGGRTSADAALVGAVLIARDERAEARRILEAARAGGDDRKEIAGPLIQILVLEGEVARAAALAFDILDSLSDEDARKVVELAFEHKSYEWASRLSEALFERGGVAEDAYAAARSRALEGDRTGALALLRRAVAAGFSDAARAWSDSALERLRGEPLDKELEAVLPRPDGARS